MLWDGLDEKYCEMHIPLPPPPPTAPVYIMLHAVVSWAFSSSSPPAHLRSPSPPEKLKSVVKSWPQVIIIQYLNTVNVPVNLRPSLQFLWASLWKLAMQNYWPCGYCYWHNCKGQNARDMKSRMPAQLLTPFSRCLLVNHKNKKMALNYGKLPKELLVLSSQNDLIS